MEGRFLPTQEMLEHACKLTGNAPVRRKKLFWGEGEGSPSEDRRRRAS